jgi:hypothetical protein
MRLTVEPHRHKPPLVVERLDLASMDDCARAVHAYSECFSYQELCKKTAEQWAFGHSTHLREWCFDLAAERCFMVSAGRVKAICDRSR